MKNETEDKFFAEMQEEFDEYPQGPLHKGPYAYGEKREPRSKWNRMFENRNLMTERGPSPTGSMDSVENKKYLEEYEKGNYGYLSPKSVKIAQTRYGTKDPDLLRERFLKEIAKRGDGFQLSEDVLRYTMGVHVTPEKRRIEEEFDVEAEDSANLISWPSDTLVDQSEFSYTDPLVDQSEFSSIPSYTSVGDEERKSLDPREFEGLTFGERDDPLDVEETVLSDEETKFLNHFTNNHVYDEFRDDELVGETFEEPESYLSQWDIFTENVGEVSESASNAVLDAFGVVSNLVEGGHNERQRQVIQGIRPKFLTPSEILRQRVLTQDGKRALAKTRMQGLIEVRKEIAEDETDQNVREDASKSLVDPWFSIAQLQEFNRIVPYKAEDILGYNLFMDILGGEDESLAYDMFEAIANVSNSARHHIVNNVARPSVLAVSGVAKDMFTIAGALTTGSYHLVRYLRPNRLEMIRNYYSEDGKQLNDSSKTFVVDLWKRFTIDDDLVHWQGAEQFWEETKDSYDSFSDWKLHVALSARDNDFLRKLADDFQIPPEDRNRWQGSLMFGVEMTPFGGFGLAARGGKFVLRNAADIRLINKAYKELGDKVDISTKRSAIISAATDFRINRLEEYGVPAAVYKALVNDKNIKQYAKKYGWTAEQARKARRNDIIALSSSLGAMGGHGIGGIIASWSNLSKEDSELLSLGMGISGSFGIFNKFGKGYLVEPSNRFLSLFAYIGQAETKGAMKIKDGLFNWLKKSNVDPAKMRTSKFLKSYLKANGFTKENIITMRNVAEDTGNNTINRARKLREEARKLKTEADADGIVGNPKIEQSEKLFKEADELIEKNTTSGLLIRDADTNEISINLYHHMEKHVNVSREAVDFNAAFKRTIESLPKEDQERMTDAMERSFEILNNLTSKFPDLETEITISLAEALQSAPLFQLQKLLQSKLEVSARKGKFFTDASLLAETNRLRESLQGRVNIIDKGIRKTLKAIDRYSKNGNEEQVSTYTEVAALLQSLKRGLIDPSTNKKLDAMNDMYRQMKLTHKYGDQDHISLIENLIGLNREGSDIVGFGSKVSRVFIEKLSNAEITSSKPYDILKAEAKDQGLEIDIRNILEEISDDVYPSVQVARRSSVAIQDSTWNEILRDGTRKFFQERFKDKELSSEEKFQYIRGIFKNWGESNQSTPDLKDNLESILKNIDNLEEQKQFARASTEMQNILAENGFVSKINLESLIELKSKLWKQAQTAIVNNNGQEWNRKVNLIEALDARLEDATNALDSGTDFKKRLIEANEQYKLIMVPWINKSSPVRTVFDSIKENGYGVAPEQFYLKFLMFPNADRSRKFFDKVFLEEGAEKHSDETLQNLLESIGFGLELGTLQKKHLLNNLPYFRDVFDDTRFKSAFDEVEKLASSMKTSAGLSAGIEKKLADNVIGLVDQLKNNYKELFENSLQTVVFDLKATTASADDIWKLIRNDFSSIFPFRSRDDVAGDVAKARQAAKQKLYVEKIKETENYKEVSEKIRMQYEELFPDSPFPSEETPTPIQLILAIAKKNAAGKGEEGLKVVEEIKSNLQSLFAHEMIEEGFSLTGRVILETKDLAKTLKEMPELRHLKLELKENSRLLEDYIVGIKQGDPAYIQNLKELGVDPKKLTESKFKMAKEIDLAKMVSYYEKNKHHFKELYTPEELKTLDEIFEITGLTIADNFDRMTLTGMHAAMTTQMILGRGYNVMKGVVSPRYVFAELSINKWREQRFLMLKEILNNPEYAKSFSDIFSHKNKYVSKKSLNYFIKKTMSINILAQSRAEARELDRRKNYISEEDYTTETGIKFYDENMIKRRKLFVNTDYVEARIFKDYRNKMIDYLTNNRKEVK